MSDAFYHKGLTIECDWAIPRISIDGRVPTEILSNLFDPSDPPTVKTEKLLEYGKHLIDQSAELKKREAARQDHLAILKEGGVPAWNNWRTENPTIRPLLYDGPLTKEALGHELNGADFANAVLINANLREQKLRGANFHEANLGKANLSKADLTGANFCRADLYETEMPNATLNDANLQGAQLAKTNFEGDETKLIGCSVYGMSAWDLKLKGAEQRDLVIRYRHRSPGANGEDSEALITVDDLEVAQFIYLLLDNQNLTKAIDTIGKKGVLILGRFTKERKAILDEIRNRLRAHRFGFVPIMFDFGRPAGRDYTETIRVLAGLSLFIIADITDPRSIPLELQAIVPQYMIPLIPILEEGKEKPFAMFRDLQQMYKWVLTIQEYTPATLPQIFDQAVVQPALEAADRLRSEKSQAIRVRRASDYT